MLISNRGFYLDKHSFSLYMSGGANGGSQPKRTCFSHIHFHRDG